LTQIRLATGHEGGAEAVVRPRDMLETSLIATPLVDRPRSGHDVEPASAESRFEQIYGSHVDFVWRSARRLGVPESMVDDVVQQVFLTVHRKLGDFEGRSSLKTWIFSILLRTARDHRRGVRRKSPHWQAGVADPDQVADDARGPHEALVHAEAWRVVDELLESLEGDKRVVFVLAELEQMTAQEISDATGLPPKTVYSRLRAARTDFERAAARVRRRLGREP
jgi:RNA polymerase sigma-70 factor (ECF subfamily)